jgi:penicillin-binding protein 1A
MMKGVVNKGTAASIRPHYGLGSLALAGKTGTTQSNADAWFMAMTPDIVAGCWIGFEQPSVHFASSGTGATAAMPIVGKFLSKSYGDIKLKLNPNAVFPSPPDSTISINFDCSVVHIDSLKNTPLTYP